MVRVTPVSYTHLDVYKRQVYNIGNHQPVELMTFIETIEKALGREAQKNFLPMQAGDVLATYADIDDSVSYTHLDVYKRQLQQPATAAQSIF